MQVVNGGQHGAKHFTASIEVVQVSAAETFAAAVVPAHPRGARTSMAGAAGVYGLRVGFVAGVAQFQVAIASILTAR